MTATPPRGSVVKVKQPTWKDVSVTLLMLKKMNTRIGLMKEFKLKIGLLWNSKMNKNSIFPYIIFVFFRV